MAFLPRLVYQSVFFVCVLFSISSVAMGVDEAADRAAGFTGQAYAEIVCLLNTIYSEGHAVMQRFTGGDCSLHEDDDNVHEVDDRIQQSQSLLQLQQHNQPPAQSVAQVIQEVHEGHRQQPEHCCTCHQNAVRLENQRIRIEATKIGFNLLNMPPANSLECEQLQSSLRKTVIEIIDATRG